jgi:transcriptional regulator with XRE-family HTH domain
MKRRRSPSERAFGKRLKEVLTEFKRVPGSHLTWDGVATSLNVDKKTLARWFSADNFPRSKQLHSIAQLTGCSVDWLLGFPDAPRRRGDNIQREAGAELRSRLEQIESDERYAASTPGGLDTVSLRKWLDPVPESPAKLIKEATEALSERRLARLAKLWTLKMQQLALRMREDLESAQDRDERANLVHVASLLDFEAQRLESSESLLNSLGHLDREEPLLAASHLLTSRHGDAILQTPFPVWGPWGLAWRGAKHDDVWCIRRNAGTPSALDVYVRRRAKFLLPSPLEEFEFARVPTSPTVVRRPIGKRANAAGRKRR